MLAISGDDDEQNETKRRKLNIGAGKTYLPGFTNVDIAPHAEISLDLNEDTLPLADDSVEIAFSYHTLEHLHNYIGALAEIHRVMKHGGRLFIGVPYVSSTERNLINPYHRQHFNEYSFDFFEPGKKLGSAAETGGIMFLKVFHRFHYVPEFAGKSERRKEWCRRHLFNVVRKIDFGLIALKAGHPSIPVGRHMAGEFEAQFDELFRSRTRYDRGVRRR